jgi:small ubiquitin-related modifier
MSTDASEAEHITLKVKSQDGNELFFKIKRSTPLKKLMDAYCSRNGVNPNTVRFLFDGNRIKENDTPIELQLQNDDQIDAMVEQSGGFYRII